MSAALAARGAAITPCRAPRNERPATYRYLTGLHNRDEVPLRPRLSKHGCRPVTLDGLVSHYLHHIFITAKPERRTLLRTVVIYCFKRAAQKMQKKMQEGAPFGF